MKIQNLIKKSVYFTLVFSSIFNGVGVYAQNSDETLQNNSQNSVTKTNFYGKVVDQVSESSSTLINNAMKLIGVRYRWGDTVQTGFDASAFVKYVLKDNLGFLFRVKTTDDMSKVGLQVSRDSLKPGDLVFFNTLQRENSHVGIYVGENKFIHSPARGSGVRVDDMTSVYWNMRFDGARRVDNKGINEVTVSQ